MRKNLFLLICLLVFSCSNKYNHKEFIDLDQLEETSVLDLFDSINVVALETNDQSLISIISKIVQYNDRYYILDAKMQTILCFDTSGKYLFKISQQGQGPSEYSFLGNMNIDPYNKQLLILAPFGELLSYSLDGQFISKIKLPSDIIAYNEVYPLNKDELIFISSNKYQILYYSKITNSITKKKYENNEMLKSSIFSPLNSTHIYNDTIYFSPPLSNDVLNLSNLDNFFTWDFGEKNNSKKMIANIESFVLAENEFVKRDFVSEKKINYDIVYNYQSDSFRICLIDCGGYNFKHIFLEKKTGKYKVFDKTKENIRFIFPDFCGKSVIMYDRGFGNDIPIDMTYYNLDILSEENKKIIINHNKEFDNPFIIVYELSNKF